MPRRRTALIVLMILLFGVAGMSPFTVRPAAAQMRPTPISDRLAPWPTVYPPTQADEGAQEYYQRCMVCHGDRGQGLTEEWRGVLDPADQNCWQSGCHNVRHPVNGFVFPKLVPAVVGKGVLSRYASVQDLYHYLKTKMPYQTPGSLSDEIYWQLTAYLLRSNGYDFGNSPLDEERAASISLVAFQKTPNVDSSFSWQVWWPLLLTGLVILIVLIGWGITKIRNS